MGSSSQNETEVSRNYLKDISILEVLTNGRSEFYKVTSLSNESITLTNVGQPPTV